MSPDDLIVITEADVLALLTPLDVVGVIERALASGVDPSADPDRSIVATRSGQMLLMPTEVGTRLGVKVATVAPANSGTPFPRIQGLLLLFDAATLQPLSAIDGIALTTLRTPAVSVAAVHARIVAGTAPLRLVVYGTGPQGVAHAVTIADLVASGRGIESIVYVVRSARPRPQTLPFSGITSVILDETVAARNALRTADVVVCATTASEPLFDSTLLADTVTVVAVGSHEPDKRELDGALLGRSTVIVEDVTTALREAGDLILAIDEGHLSPDDLVPLTVAFANSDAIDPARPLIFKSTGMAWEDVVVATRVDELWRERRSASAIDGVEPDADRAIMI